MIILCHYYLRAILLFSYKNQILFGLCKIKNNIRNANYHLQVLKAISLCGFMMSNSNRKRYGPHCIYDVTVLGETSSKARLKERQKHTLLLTSWITSVGELAIPKDLYCYWMSDRRAMTLVECFVAVGLVRAVLL